MRQHSVGIVVPTLGQRVNFLKAALTSIRDAGHCFISIICPDPSAIESVIPESLFDTVILDPRRGLAGAINKGFDLLPQEIMYINWLGDDDLLTPDSLLLASAALDTNKDCVLVYGDCEYITETEALLWRNRPRRIASALLHFGPQLVPQPGSLFRRDAFVKAGSLNTELKYAFDLDLMLRLKQLGKFHYLDATLARFRWHSGSLSVGQRKSSVAEASRIRQIHAPRKLRWLHRLWEIPMRRIIQLAGFLLNSKLRRMSVT